MSESTDNSKHTKAQIWLDILFFKNDPLWGFCLKMGYEKEASSIVHVNRFCFLLMFNKCTESKLPVEPQTPTISLLTHGIDLGEQIR